MLEIMLSPNGQPAKNYTYSLVSLADRPTAASHNTACVLDGKIYVGGGLATISGVNQSITNFDVYDVASNSWTSRAALATKLRSGAMAAYGNYVVWTGGYDQQSATWYGTTRFYSISGNSWNNGGTSITPNRADIAYTKGPSDKLYIFGGQSGSGVITNQNSVMTITSGPPGSVSGLTTFANIRFAGCVFDGYDYIYIAGGYDASGTPVNTFRRYRISTNSWETLASLPSTTHSCALIMWDGNVYAYSGYYNGAYGNRLFRYQVTTNTWTDLGGLTGEIHGTTCGVVYNNELYLIGGYNGSARHGKISKLTRTEIP